MTDNKDIPNYNESPKTDESKLIMETKNSEIGLNYDPWWWLVVAAVVAVLVLIFLRPDPFMRILNFVKDGIWVTIFTTLVSFILILILGLAVALCRLSTKQIVKSLATTYVEIIRGIPLLVQLLFWYFAFPSVVQGIGESLNIEALKNYLANPFAMAILGLTFCYAAYMSEIYRAGIQSIPRGQMEAARSLGMTYIQSMRHIIIPQAIRVILPPVGNEFIALLKDSSLVSIVAVADMTRRGREFMAANFNPIETWVMVALLYLVLTLFTARVVRWTEQKYKSF